MLWLGLVVLSALVGAIVIVGVFAWWADRYFTELCSRFRIR